MGENTPVLRVVGQAKGWLLVSRLSLLGFVITVILSFDEVAAKITKRQQVQLIELSAATSNFVELRRDEYDAWKVGAISSCISRDQCQPVHFGVSADIEVRQRRIPGTTGTSIL